MKILWAVILAAVPFHALGAQAPPAAEKLRDNAALKYWIAFALMPQFTPEQDAIFGNWRETPLNDAAAAEVAKSENVLRIFHEAAKFPRCDWGLVNEGPTTLLPHLNKARQLARVACLRARYRAGKGDGEGAVQDLLDVFVLSRHCNAKDGPLISHFVQIAIQTNATNAAVDNLKRLHPDQLKKLAAGLEVLPAAKGFREAILNERDDMLGWAIERLKKDGIKAGEEVKTMLAGETGDPKLLPKGKVTQETVDELIREFEKAKEYYTQWAETGALPLAEFERQTKLIEEKLNKECPITAAILFAPLPTARYEEARSEAQMTMLKAAIAIVLDGPDRVKHFKDPFGDGPFEYAPAGNGFQLKSKLNVGDTAVGLTVY